MTGIVICSNENLHRIKPYLSEFFNHEKYVSCSELDIQYDIGKWKAKNVLKLCAEKKVDKILFAVSNEFFRDIARKLRRVSELGIDTYFIPYYSYPEITSAEKLKDALFRFDISKPRLKYLEFHVNDHCNLNCKGCTHYCNLELTPKFTDILQWREDIHQLKRLFWGIDVIRIMGGEPLLNLELPKYIRETRLLFPDADIRVVTNGLLIPKISDELMSSMKDSHVRFDISHYIPTDKLLEPICNKLKSEGIDYFLSEQIITHFLRVMTINPINEEGEAYNHCISKGCNIINGGMIYNCPMTYRIPIFNTEYNQHLPIDTGIRLSEVTDGWELYNKLNSPIPFCKYCSPYPESFEWEQKKGSNAEMSDWMVDEDKLPLLKEEWTRKQNELVQKSPRAYIIHVLDKHELVGRLVRHSYFKLLHK